MASGIPDLTAVFWYEMGSEERMLRMNIFASWFQSIWIFLGSMLFILVLIWILFKILQAQSRDKNNKD